ncbi:MAG: UPF0175 family protein [Promethearchaeota archaeon]
MSERLSLVIPATLKEKIDRLKKKTRLDQSALIRKLLTAAVEEMQVKLAIEEYKDGKLSPGKAVEFSGTDYWTFIELLRLHNIPHDIDTEDLKKEMERIDNKKYAKLLKNKAD